LVLNVSTYVFISSGIFYFVTELTLAPSSTGFPISVVTGDLQGLKRPDRQAAHSPLSNDKV